VTPAIKIISRQESSSGTEDELCTLIIAFHGGMSVVGLSPCQSHCHSRGPKVINDCVGLLVGQAEPSISCHLAKNSYLITTMVMGRLSVSVEWEWMAPARPSSSA